jgi:hypothetical protein
VNNDWFITDCSKNEKNVILVECNTPSKNKIFRDTINTHHSYVKYKDSPTRNIRWLVYETSSGNLVGAVGLSSATIAVASRDAFIGWDNETKMRNLGMLANNSRFCLVRQNITMKNVGSMTLKQLRIVGSARWKEKYNQPLVLLETFVQADRDTELDGYKKRNGAIYLASNWINVGMTKGNSIRKAPTLLWKKESGKRGELARENPQLAWEKYGYGDKSHVITKSLPKMIFIKPICKDWKELLLSK